jgi:hypothetical protein
MDNVKALVIDRDDESRASTYSSLIKLGFEVAGDVSKVLSRNLPEDVESL